MNRFRSVWAALTSREQKKAVWLSLGDALIALSDVGAMGLFVYLVQQFLKNGNTSTQVFNLPVYELMALLLLLFVIKNFTAYRLQQLQLHFAYNIAARISKLELEGFFSGSFADFLRIDSSKEIRKISQQPVEFAHYVISGWQTIGSQTMLIAVYLFALLLLKPLLVTLLIIAFVPVMIIFASRSKKYRAQLRHEARLKSEQSLQYLKEALNGFVEKQLYDEENFLVSRFSKAQSALNDHLSAIQTLQFLPGRVMEVLIVATMCGMLVLAQFSPISTVLLGGFLVAAWRIIPAVVKTMNAFSQISVYQFAIPATMPRAAAIKNADEHLRSLELDDVSFSHNGKKLWQNVSVRIESGDIVGITGPSGSGKSTLLQVLLGFYPPQSGRILVNKKEAQAIGVQRRSAYVKQEEFFMHDQLPVNVTMRSKVNDEKRYEAVHKVSGLRHFTTDLDEHQLYQEGRNISGGQRQRISLARALYKDADLLVLDEPFSELDHVAEDIFLKHLKDLSAEGKMIVLVTHNKKAFDICNKMIHLDA